MSRPRHWRESAEYLTTEQVALHLGIGKNRMEQLIAEGSIKAINVASSKERRPAYRISRAEVKRFEAARAVAKGVKP